MVAVRDIKRGEPVMLGAVKGVPLEEKPPNAMKMDPAMNIAGAVAPDGFVLGIATRDIKSGEALLLGDLKPEQEAGKN